MRISFTIQEENGELDVEALCGDVVIGYARGEREGNRLQLLDFQVEELSLPGADLPAGTPLRGHRIGTELLTRFLQNADAAKVHETWGCVTGDDIDETPHLLAIYQKHGFTVQEPDDECESNATMKIVRRR